MSIARRYDAGRYIKAEAGLALNTVPSSSGGVLATGLTIDRQALTRRFYSCRSVIIGAFTGSSVNNVVLTPGFQHSSDGTSWDNFSTGTVTTKAIGSTGATGAQTVRDTAEQIVNLRGARRYVRQTVTPAFNGSSTGDSLSMMGTVVFGGADEQPSS